MAESGTNTVPDSHSQTTSSSSPSQMKQSENENDGADNTENSRDSPSVNTITSNMAILDGKYFKIVQGKNSLKTNDVVATCVACLPKIVEVKGTLTSTSNFKSHLKRRHDSNLVKEYEKYCKEKRAKLSASDCSDENQLASRKKRKLLSLQEQLDEDITQFVVHSMTPLRIVDDPYFQAIFDHLKVKARGKPITVLSRRSLGRRIKDLYESNTKSIKKILTEEAQYICTTADVWSSKKRSFLGVTAHWININSLKRQSAVLACRRFQGTHSFDRIAEMLCDIHSEFGLDSSKILATVTDNASNFAKAFRVLGVKLCNFQRDVDGENNEFSDTSADEESDDEDFQSIPMGNIFFTSLKLMLHLHYY
ncbi:uncharacterized protein LOC143894193 [Temnothorax americanus]|uniref:uncharacterized protein LOC143894193 n=1 Tax=Temnothorax americanus TaxID=1964332 RepID=UPI004068E063